MVAPRPVERSRLASATRRSVPRVEQRREAGESTGMRASSGRHGEVVRVQFASGFAHSNLLDMDSMDALGALSVVTLFRSGCIVMVSGDGSSGGFDGKELVNRHNG
jgi:hypothetical protein